MNENFVASLYKIIEKHRVFLDEPMSKHTTFKIGGNADYLVKPSNIAEIKEIIKVCKKYNISYFVIGNGSNVLVADKGYRGLIIKLFNNFCDIQVGNDSIKATSGVSLSRIASAALENGLTGFEFAAGIPGSFGGAIRMNAGAYNGEMKDIVIDVTLLNSDGDIVILDNDHLNFGYRSSIIEEQELIVLEGRIRLDKGDKKDIKSKMDELKRARIEKQPLEYPSAGSTFKRPEGYFAGKLIMDAGLRGFSVGGAEVSTKHCGFVINKGGATAKDVVNLVEAVSEKVMDSFGVVLEPEIRMIGEF